MLSEWFRCQAAESEAEGSIHKDDFTSVEVKADDADEEVDLAVVGRI